MKKHSLIKVMMVTLLLVMVATWGLSITTVSNGEFVSSDSTKIGIFTVASYLIVAIQYFFNIALYVLAVGGFYGVLHRIPQYRLLLDKVAHGFRNFEWLFMIIVGIVFAALSSMGGFSIPILVLFPLVTSIILLMGYDKVTAAMLTIGSTIAGLIGTVFSASDVYGITAVLGVNANDNIGWKFLLLVVSLVIVLVNTILYARRHKNTEELEEKYLIPKEVKTENRRVFPLVLVFDTILVILILAFISWDLFEVDVFKNITSTFVKPVGNGFTKGLFNVLNTILGVPENMAFGNWSLTEASIVLFLGSGLLSLMYKVSMNDYLTAFGKGVKKALKPAALVILAYTILVCVTNVPFELTILKPIINLNKEVSVVTMCIVALVFSLFTVEPYYGITTASSYVKAVALTESKVLMASLAWQSIYGVTMLIAPTSVILMATLSYLGVSYGKWLKAIWQMLLELILAIVIILLFV